MSNLTTVTRRLQREVGLSGEEAKRIANKLNTLAGSVPWATPVGVIRKSRAGRLAPEGAAKPKTARKAAKKR